MLPAEAVHEQLALCELGGTRTIRCQVAASKMSVPGKFVRIVRFQIISSQPRILRMSMLRTPQNMHLLHVSVPVFINCCLPPPPLLQAIKCTDPMVLNEYAQHNKGKSFYGASFLAASRTPK